VLTNHPASSYTLDKDDKGHLLFAFPTRKNFGAYLSIGYSGEVNIEPGFNYSRMLHADEHTGFFYFIMKYKNLFLIWTTRFGVLAECPKYVRRNLSQVSI
jgi:hypothetical protein